MSRTTFTVKLSAAQVAELMGILAARQQLAQRMYRACAAEPRTSVAVGAHWQAQVIRCEELRQAITGGVTGPALPVLHDVVRPGHA